MLQKRKAVLLLGDIVALFAAFFVMALIRFGYTLYTDYGWKQLKLFGGLFIIWFIILYIFDLYNLRRVNPNPRNIGLLALGIGTSSLVSVLVFYLFPTEGVTPKTNLAIVAVVSCIFLILWRRLFYILLSSRYKQTIAVIGQGPEVETLRTAIQTHPHLGQIVYVHPTYDAAHKLPSINILVAHNIPIDSLLAISHATGCEVLSLSQAYEELFAKVPLTLMTEEKAVSILTKRKELSYTFLERIIEIVCSGIVLIVLSPFLLIAMLLIYLQDRGPVFYTQKRVGKNGKVFSFYKLRTMITASETNGAQWATKRDPRITRIGMFLRKSHIDEIPQMINVLRGDMALIGPRPERPEFVQELEAVIPYYFLRHTIRPGFTGWAQIKFRYASSVDDSYEKLEYDLYYLKNKNPLLDLGILIKTIQIIFTH